MACTKKHHYNYTEREKWPNKISDSWHWNAFCTQVIMCRDQEMPGWKPDCYGKRGDFYQMTQDK